jgi:hypothetical protein
MMKLQYEKETLISTFELNQLKNDLADKDTGTLQLPGKSKKKVIPVLDWFLLRQTAYDLNRGFELDLYF